MHGDGLVAMLHRTDATHGLPSDAGSSGIAPTGTMHSVELSGDDESSEAEAVAAGYRGSLFERLGLARATSSASKRAPSLHPAPKKSVTPSKSSAPPSAEKPASSVQGRAATCASVVNLVDDGRMKRLIDGVQLELSALEKEHNRTFTMGDTYDAGHVFGRSQDYQTELKARLKGTADLIAKLKALIRRVDQSKDPSACGGVPEDAKAMIDKQIVLKTLLTVLTKPTVAGAELTDAMQNASAVHLPLNYNVVGTAWKAHVDTCLLHGTYDTCCLEFTSDSRLPLAFDDTLSLRTVAGQIGSVCMSSDVTTVSTSVYIVEDAILGLLVKTKVTELKKTGGAGEMLITFLQAFLHQADLSGSEFLPAQIVEDVRDLYCLMNLTNDDLRKLGRVVDKAETDAADDATLQQCTPLRQRLLRHDVGKLIVANARAFLGTNGSSLRWQCVRHELDKIIAKIVNVLHKVDIEPTSVIEDELVKAALPLAKLAAELAKDPCSERLHAFQKELEAAVVGVCLTLMTARVARTFESAKTWISGTWAVVKKAFSIMDGGSGGAFS